ncbi:MAG: hypothetical protein COB04_05425 [Gammaproteobacteria bacterium]|nr:MAG: hypothetical protein COB04_05425 [Gammaproteobacteria bacterium]
MSDKFYVWAAKIEADAAVLVDMDGFDNDYELDVGLAQLDTYPSGVTLRMDSRKPSHTLLVDSVKNTQGVVLVSEKMKVFLDSQLLADVEFLPITVLDHKGRKLDAGYYIFHPINNVDCLDLENAEPEWDDIDDTVVASVKALVIDGAKLPEDKRYFRPKHYIARPMVTKALADAIISAGFTGVQFLPASEISGSLR